jgi:hypothetical protein
MLRMFAMIVSVFSYFCKCFRVFHLFSNVYCKCCIRMFSKVVDKVFAHAATDLL